MELDVRQGTAEVTQIRFADESCGIGQAQADLITKGNNDIMEIHETYSGDYLRVRTKEGAENLIKALQSAIEMGWVK